MRALPSFLVAGLIGGWTCTVAEAADLRVAPVIVEPSPGARTTTLNVVNGEDRPLKAQIRVMKWTQRDGQDVLSPTRDVVASPPFISLKAKERYLVRVVRTAKAQPSGEESYRILVDQVPDPAAVKPGTVNLILRQSIPAFFSDMPRHSAKVDWKIVGTGSNLLLVGRNNGNRRIRLSDVALETGKTSIYKQPGLVGYVLPGSEMRWPILSTGALPADGRVHMTAMTDAGPVDVSLVAQPSV
jgi:fimbrial chaperone protein